MLGNAGEEVRETKESHSEKVGMQEIKEQNQNKHKGEGPVGEKRKKERQDPYIWFFPSHLKKTI